MSDQFLSHLWDSVGGRIRDRIGLKSFNSWFRQLSVAAVDEDHVVLLTSSSFLKDWLKGHYHKLLLQEFQRDLPHIRDVVVEVRAKVDKAAPAKQAEERLVALPEVPMTGPAVSGGPEMMANTLDPQFTFDNFVVGKANELAYAAARRVADSNDVAFNPLFLYAGVGLGKTHLMQAIAWQIMQRNPARKVLYLSAENFMYHFIRAVRFKDTMSFKERFRSIDVLMIDDLQFFIDKDSTQEEFFHTFNALVDGKHQVVISADRSPSDLEGMEERVRSRLGWGLVADIHQTTFELRVGILEQKASHYTNIDIPDDVIRFLAHRITSNVRELEGALKKIVFHHELVGRDVTLELAQEVLADLLRVNARKVSVEDIQVRVAEHFSIKVTDMSSSRRARAVARPRQVAIYLAKKLTSQSLPAIGRRFGNRDHTTVLHGVRRIEELMQNDAALAEDLRLLEAALSDPAQKSGR